MRSISPASVLTCALMACGGATRAEPQTTVEAAPVAAEPAPVAAEAPTEEVAVVTDEPATEPETPSPMPGPMTADQRRAIEPLLARYGSGWWLENLERSYSVSVVETPTEYMLVLDARGASGLRAVVHATKDGHLSNDALTIPDGPEPSAEQLAAVERVVRAERTVWVNRYEGDTTAIDLRRGIAALLGDTPREARMRDGAAVFYTRGDEYGPLLSVVVDLEAGHITEVRWHDVPSSDNGLLPSADIAAIDEAMRLHGDFGVYGSVSAGLIALARDQRVNVHPNAAGSYSVSIASPSGHGHRISFRVDVATRTLDGVAAGHTVGVHD